MCLIWRLDQYVVRYHVMWIYDLHSRLVITIEQYTVGYAVYHAVVTMMPLLPYCRYHDASSTILLLPCCIACSYIITVTFIVMACHTFSSMAYLLVYHVDYTISVS